MAAMTGRRMCVKLTSAWPGASPRATALRRESKIGGHPMKLSARNQGKIVDVKKGATTAHVRIDIGGQIVTASITNESTDELKLEKGKTAYAIIKATSVMVGVD